MGVRPVEFRATLNAEGVEALLVAETGEAVVAAGDDDMLATLGSCEMPTKRHLPRATQGVAIVRREPLLLVRCAA